METIVVSTGWLVFIRFLTILHQLEIKMIIIIIIIIIIMIVIMITKNLSGAKISCASALLGIANQK